MASPKHTPGPWTAVYTPSMKLDGVHIRPRTNTLEIAYCNSSESTRPEADARLIAAAPELLEACLEAFKHLDHLGDCKHDPDPTYDSTGHIQMGRMPCPVCMLERATAKARGDV